jgi:nitrate reductase assembly molybdenum cofactor insertion protein NarJ
MTEKVRKVSILLQALSRVPGLSFLADTERDLREAADQVDDMGDRVDEAKRQYRDVHEATADVLRREDDN